MRDNFTVQAGDDPDDCRAQGGVVSSRIEDHRNVTNSIYAGQIVKIWTCRLPAAKPASSGDSINVSVPTQVSTQVSPQISPAMVQQQQPTNSPVSASPGMVGAPVSPAQSPGQTGPSHFDAPPGVTSYQPSAPVGTVADQEPDPLTKFFADYGRDAMEKLKDVAAPPPQPSSGTTGAGYSPSISVSAPGGGGEAAPMQAGMNTWQMVLLALVGGGFALTALKGKTTIRRSRRR